VLSCYTPVSVTYTAAVQHYKYDCDFDGICALGYLFERILAGPASLAPVERVFSKSGLIVRPHHAKMSDKLLESLVFAKCFIFR